jgi:hypothetical protein
VASREAQTHRQLSRSVLGQNSSQMRWGPMSNSDPSKTNSRGCYLFIAAGICIGLLVYWYATWGSDRQLSRETMSEGGR